MHSLVDLNLGPLGLGGGAFSGVEGGYAFGEISNEAVSDILAYALEREIRVIDLAPIYGFGAAEKRVGKALKSLEREKFTLISKGGIDWHDNKRVNLCNRPETLEKMLHDSLRRLETDYIDLYFIHWPDPRIDIRFGLEFLAKAQMQGKIRSIGLGNTHFADLEKAIEVHIPTAIQNELNLFTGDLPSDLRDLIQEQKIKLMSHSTFDKGILTRRAYEGRVYPRHDARSWAPWWKKQKRKNEKFKKAIELEAFAQKEDISLVQLCLQGVMAMGSDCPLIGVKSVSELGSALDALRLEISPKALSWALDFMKLDDAK